MKKSLHLSKLRNTALVGLFFASFLSNAQTNVYDDIIAASADHTSLAAAISTAGLESALQDASATLTVFAPDNDAFDDLALELGTDIPGLLALPNLGDILLYHVLGVSADAASITNGDVVTPLDPSNTIKLTKTSAGAVYANQAMVEAADLTADNGFVHSIDAVILAKETVADVAIDNGFSTLVTAVATAELLPALTDPFAELTVFAPDNAAFDALAVALNTDLNGILALPNLQDVLLYHVVGATVLSTDLVSGPVTMLNVMIAERPQQMLMRVSVGIHKEDIDSAIKTYNLMSEGWFTHATPTLFNSGTPKPQMSSCFLLTMKEDSISGIYDINLQYGWKNGT